MSFTDWVWVVTSALLILVGIGFVWFSLRPPQPWPGWPRYRKR